MERIRQSGQRVEKLDKTLIDHHIAELDFQISRQLDAVMHHQEFQQVESLWRGLKQLVDNTDYRQNVKTEILDVAKDDLRQDFEDAPELIQSGMYWHTYTAEYDTPGGEPIGSVISAYEFDASPQDVALLRNISRVSAAAHMPFIGAVGPAFFLKETMEEVAAIKDIATTSIVRNISAGRRFAKLTMPLHRPGDAARAGSSAVRSGHRAGAQLQLCRAGEGPGSRKISLDQRGVLLRI